MKHMSSGLEKMNSRGTDMNIKNKMKTSTKVKLILFAAFVVAIIIFTLIKPDEETMRSCASAEMKALIAKDESSDRKRVTINYNSLGFINYCSFTSSGYDEQREVYVGFAGKIFQADEGAGKVVGQFVTYTYRMLGRGQNVLHGVKLTVLLTTIATIAGIILGFFLALGKMSKMLIVRKICAGYIFFFRGTPLLIQLFVLYFTVPSIFGFAWRDLFSAADSEAVFKGSFVAACIAFALNSGAYCAEIIRAGIQSIDKGQYEAAKALGMNYGKTMSKIIVPQSIRRLVPPLCNEFIMILKDASLVFAISLMDISTISKNIMTNEGSYIVFIPALLIYLLVTAIFTFIFNRIEKKFSVYE